MSDSAPDQSRPQRPTARPGDARASTPDATRPGFPWWFVLALFGSTALALAIRLYKLSEGSFWNDELLTVISSVQLRGTNISKMLGYIPTRIGVVLAGVPLDAVDGLRPETWKSLGITREALRLPHVAIGVATVPLIMLAARRVIGNHASALLGLLVALSCWHIYWSQAARFYILQCMFFGLAILLWYDGTRRRAPIVYCLAMACALLAFWSQPVAILAFGIFGLDWLIAMARREPIAMRAWHYAIGIICFSTALGVWGYDWTVRTEQWDHFFGEDRWLSWWEVLLGVAYVAWPATAVFAALSGLELARRRRTPGVLLCLASVVPPIFFAMLSFFAFTGSRYAFMCLGPVLAVAAWGAVEIGRTLRERGLGLPLVVAPAAALLAGQAFSTAIYFRSGGLFRVPMDQAAAYLAVHAAPEEPIYAHEPYVLAYEMQRATLKSPRDPAEIESMTEPAWFVFTTNPSSGVDQRMNARGLDHVASFRLVQVHSKAEVRVFRFTPLDSAPPGSLDAEPAP